LNKYISKLTAWPITKLTILIEYLREVVFLKLYCWLSTVSPTKHWEDVEEDLQERNVILMHFWVEKFDRAEFDVFGGFIKPDTNFTGPDMEAYLSMKPVLMTRSQAASAAKRFRKYMGTDKSEFLRRYTLNL
jgi:hypothetical protein